MTTSTGTTSTGPLRAAIYLRVSKKEQAEGHSIDSQRAILTAWAEREGWGLVAEYADEGGSAKDLNRPSLQRALRAATAPGGPAFDLLLVRSRTRYARDVADAATTDKLLRAHGVRVFSHDEPATNDETPAAVLYRGISDVFAQNERLELAHRIRLGNETKARRKGLHNRRIPFGYLAGDDPRNDPMQAAEEEAAAVRWAFEAFARGTHTQGEIADELTRRGLRPHSPASRPRETWAASTVASMLRGRVYLGEVMYRGEWYPGRHEAIVSPELFDRAQARIRGHRGGGTGGHAKYEYLLTGILDCARCDEPMWADRSGSGRRYYRCSSRHSRRECVVRKRGFSVDTAEGRIDHLIVATVELIAGFGDLVRDELAQAQPDDLEAERRRQEEKKRRASLLMVNGGDEATALRAIAEANARLAELSAAPEPQRVTIDLMRLGGLWPHFTRSERREAVREVFERVRLDALEGEVDVLPRAEYAAPYRALAARSGLLTATETDSHTNEVVVARSAGFEPATFASAGQRSIP